MERIIYNFKNNLISLIYTILGVELMFYSAYREFNLIYVITIAIMTILLFAFYNIVEEAKGKGPIKYIPLAIGFILLAYGLINTGGIGSHCSFVQWFFEGGRDLEANILYTLGALLLITFIFSSMFYYFTVIIIRMPVLLLLYFVVMVFYIKGPYVQGNVALYGFIVSFILLFIQKTKFSSKVDKTKVTTKIKDISLLVAVFISIILVIALIIPKFNLPKLIVLDEIKSYFQNYIAEGSKGFSTELNNSRNITESTITNPDKALYTIKTKENPVYLITHNFDVYENEEWIKANEDFLYDDADSIFEQDMIIDKTKGSLASIDVNQFQSTLNDDDVTKFQNIISADESQNEASIIIEPKYSNSTQLIHPSKINSFNDLSKKEISYLDNFDELFKVKGNKFHAGRQYYLSYYKDNPEMESKESQIMTFFNEETYSNFLKIAKSDVAISKIKSSYTQLDNYTSSRMFSLSESLTKDKNSTYHKAKAIEDYFKTGEYVYNLTLPINEGDEDYIDYFIFEGKKGYCVQYATAMTLLCRESGISARYVEGYVVDENKDYVSEGTYQVNASSGHAFVEVYIPGFGWKIFDPTPGIVGEIVTQTTNSGNSNEKIIIILGSLLIVAIIILIVVVYLKITKRSRNLRKILKHPKEEALEGIINDTIKLLAKIDVVPKKGETPLNFAISIDREINIGFTNNLESYYKYKYAMKNITKKELKAAVLVNKNTYKVIKEKVFSKKQL